LDTWQWGLTNGSPAYEGDGVIGTLATNIAPNSPPIITSLHPNNVFVEIHESTVLSVEAIGILPFSYQWFQNGSVLPFATNDLLCITNLQSNQAGNYRQNRQ
jgi:hypothetical protein